jgi:hypothetical protein
VRGIRLLRIISIVGVVSALAFGCAITRSHSSTSGQTWLDEDHLKDISSRQTYNPPADLLELRQCADVLIQLYDQENLRMLATKIKIDFSNGKFPISDLAKYFPRHERDQAIGLAVVVVYGSFPADPGKPNLVYILPKLDKVFVDGGVKRRVYEIIPGVENFELDSAEEEVAELIRHINDKPYVHGDETPATEERIKIGLPALKYGTLDLLISDEPETRIRAWHVVERVTSAEMGYVPGKGWPNGPAEEESCRQLWRVNGSYEWDAPKEAREAAYQKWLEWLNQMGSVEPDRQGPQ